MGGVDLLDSILGYYRINIRSRKWYHKIMFHTFDLVCVNSWLLWRRKTRDVMPLVDFKLSVADALCKSNKTVSRKRGRPSNEVEKQLKEKKKKGKTVAVPIVDVRLDGMGHLPIWMEKRQRCKFPQCVSKSFIWCQKYKVNLCVNNDRNCFLRFHTQ